MKQPEKHLAMVCRILWTGGVAQVAIEQQKSLLRNGNESDLFFLRDAGSLYKLPKQTHILHGQNDNNGALRKLLTNVTKKFAGHRGEGATVDLDYIIDSRKILREYDQIIFHDQWSAFLGVYYRIRGVKYAIQLHEFFRLPPGMKKTSIFAIFAWFYDFISIIIAPAIITISEYNYNIVKKFNRNTFLIRNGFPKPILSEFNSGKFITKRKVVLSLALWDRGRNANFYADLAKLLPECDFIVAGSWTIKEEMFSFIERNKDITNLKVTGRIDEEEKRRLLSTSHFYIRFGNNERGPGMGALEAMSYGMIPFANEGIGLSELIDDRVNGFLITEPLLDMTVSAIKYALNLSPKILEEMAARNLVLCNKYSWENNAKSLMEVFDKISNRKSLQ